MTQPEPLHWVRQQRLRCREKPQGVLPVQISTNGERFRFTPDGKGLVYMQGGFGAQDFMLLNLATRQTRQLTRLTNPAAMRTFDITADGKQIVFDRLRGYCAD